jgi:hypothetical protein
MLIRPRPLDAARGLSRVVDALPEVLNSEQDLSTLVVLSSQPDQGGRASGSGITKL